MKYTFLQEGKVAAYVKSEPIPESNSEPVKVVVADTLQDMVFNSGKNGMDFCLDFFVCFYFIQFMHSCIIFYHAQFFWNFTLPGVDIAKSWLQFWMKLLFRLKMIQMLSLPNL